jgi:hypothetical protein
MTAHGLRSLTEEQIGNVAQRTAYARRQLKSIVEMLAETLEGS